MKTFRPERMIGGILGGMGAAFFVWCAFILCVGLCALWVLASAVTSGVKAGTENCGQTYVVENVLSGDWFCPKGGG